MFRVNVEALWYSSTSAAFDKWIDTGGIDCRKGKNRGLVLTFYTKEAAEAVARRFKMERVHKCDVNQTEPIWPFFDGNNYYDPNEEENI